MIVTGQQPAVGGGPLYSLIKAAHALALGRARGEPAFFWCASEDHDLGEANHADVQLRDGTIRRFTADLGPGRASLRFRPVQSWWEGFVAHLERHLGPGLGAAFVRAHDPRPGEGMGAWMCRLMGDLLPGLETAEAFALRPRWKDALERSLRAWPVAALAGLRARLLAEGAADAFGELAEAPVFHDLAGGREPLTAAQALALLPEGLADISPGAALRPVLQQAALPCTAYVGGPGELAYHRFIAPVYAAAGVTAPELIPRASLTLLPGWCARAFDRRGIAPTDTVTDPPAVDENGRLTTLDALIAGLATDPAFAGSARRLQGERQHLAARLARQARRVADQPSAGLLRAWLMPRGQRQERTQCLLQAIWEHGPGLAQHLVGEAALAGPGGHRYVRLDHQR